MQVDPRDTNAGTQVDLCAHCGGMFLEFFDGEPSAISRARAPSEARAGQMHSPGVPAEDGIRCPDCDALMVRRAYLGQGPELARCESCLAVFLTPDDVEALARLTLEPEERDEPSWLTRLMRWLQGRS